jgi:heterodisulfide reductase subunit A-like polyferredoxin
VREAIGEGVGVNCHWGTTCLSGDGDKVTAVELARCVPVVDEDGRSSLTLDETDRMCVEADVVIMAIGLVPNTAAFGAEVVLNSDGTIRVEVETLQTSLPSVFAGGDAASGPSMIVKAIGQGKRAAFHIDRYLRGEALEAVRFDDRLAMVDRTAVVEQAKRSVSVRQPVALPEKPVAECVTSFEAYETTMTEEEARYSANRCLDCAGCSQCRQCVAACPADAISFDMRSEEKTVSVGSVVLATGFEVFDAHQKPALGFGRFPNVITGMQMDRILAPTRPYNAVIRPSDGMAPSNVAFVLCTGSRDEKVNNRLC